MQPTFIESYLSKKYSLEDIADEKIGKNNANVGIIGQNIVIKKQKDYDLINGKIPFLMTMPVIWFFELNFYCLKFNPCFTDCLTHNIQKWSDIL